MTVGIGVLAEASNVVILASDTRATFPNSNVGPHDECGKQWQLFPFHVSACAAGTLSVAQPLVDELTRQFIKIANPRRRKLYTGHIQKAIDEARFIIFRERVDWALKTTFGFSLRQWHRGKIPPQIFDDLIVKAGENLIRNEPLPVELIVGGFLGNHQLVFHKASQKRKIEQSTAPGVYVIGTGGQSAMDHLNYRRQNADCSLARSLFHVCEATDVARRKNRETVGRPSHLVVMWKDGTMKRFDPNCQAMRDWKKIYKRGVSTWRLQGSKVADVQVKCQMIDHEGR